MPPRRRATVDPPRGEKPETAPTPRPKRPPPRPAARYQINFDDGMLRLIEELRASYPAYRVNSVTTADVIRDALGFMYWAVQQRHEGKSVAVLDSQNNAAKVVLPFIA